VRYLDRCRRAVSLIRPDCAVVAVPPAVHRAAAYGFAHLGRLAGERAIRDWAAAREVGLLDLPALVADHVRSGAANSDGMHWGWSAHQAVGTALATQLAAQMGRAGRSDSVQ
jgi:hypothetical protein